MGSSLSDRIPEDVRERAQKAGVDDIDWYAGRLVDDADGFIVISDEERSSLKLIAEERKK